MQHLLRTVAMPAVVTTTLLVLLAPGTTVASSGDAPSGRDSDTGMVLKFTEKIVGLTQLDVGRTGVSRGDTLLYRSKLVRGGKVIGTGGGDCVSVGPKSRTIGLTYCDAALVLSDGEVAIQGFYDVTKPSGVIPVVGGSGKYRGAGGEYAFRESGSSAFDVTLRLTD